MANFNLNKVILGGRLTADPELRTTQSGLPVTTFTVAVSRNYKSNDQQPQSDFINVVAWRSTAEFVSKYFHKGSSICVIGSIQTRKWQDQNGQDRYTTEIKAQRVQFLDRRSDGPRADMGGYEDDYGAPAPAPRAPRGGNMGGGQRQAPRRPAPQQRDDDLGPAFPSEASNMDEVPF